MISIAGALHQLFQECGGEAMPIKFNSGIL